MPPLPTRDYREILHDLEEFEALLTSLGLRHAPQRLKGTIANIREIEKARTENRLLSLNTHPRVAELVWSLVEGQELAEVFQALRYYDPQTVKRMMQKALKGPVYPLDETGASNEARNTMFELALAARLRHVGTIPTIGQEADLVVDDAGARLYLECKRPVYEHTIARNVWKARKQLQRRFNADLQSNSVGGLVAISISKAINPGSNWFMVEHENDLQQLHNDVERIHRQYCSDYDRQIDLRLVGVLYEILTPAYVRSSGLIFLASQLEIFFVEPSWQSTFPVSGDSLKQFFRRMGSGS